MQEKTAGLDMSVVSKKAEQKLEWLRDHPNATDEAWYLCVREYILIRFLLEEEETEEDLLLLAQKSVSRLTGISQDKLSQIDRPSGCTAATAVVDKKILLILSLCKALNVNITVEKVPQLKKIEQLAEALHQEVKKK